MSVHVRSDMLMQMFPAEVDEAEDRFENIPVYEHVCKVYLSFDCSLCII